MRTTVTLDDDLLAKATKMMGGLDRSTVLREGLKALIERESAIRLAKLGGTQRQLQPVPAKACFRGNMILADTSVWIDYFRDDLPELGERLRRHEVVMHPFVVGELACGNFSNREATLELLQQLRSVTVAEHDEVMTFIRSQKLYGRGVGYVDVHLLAGAAIDQCQFWTLDKRLNAVAASIGIAVNP